jgi:hypothetical protein
MIEQGVLTQGADVPRAGVVVGVRRAGATRCYRTCGGDQAAQNFSLHTISPVGNSVKATIRTYLVVGINQRKMASGKTRQIIVAFVLHTLDLYVGARPVLA